MAIQFGPAFFSTIPGDASDVTVTTLGGSSVDLATPVSVDEDGRVSFAVEQPGTYVVLINDSAGFGVSYRVIMSGSGAGNSASNGTIYDYINKQVDSEVTESLPTAVIHSDGTNQTAAINTLLSSGARQVSLIGSFTITASLVVPSNVTLDATSASVSATTTQWPLVKNLSAGHATNRDTNITILGGSWSAGPTDGATHRFHLHRVDSLTVRDVRISSTAGKYGILLADVTKFTVSGVDFNTASDGVHVTGPASDGLIENLTGTTHDDFVALGCSDYLTYDYSRGDISRITVRGLKPQNTVNSRGVLMFLWGDASITNEFHMRDISVSDVSGTVGASAVLVTAANANNASSTFENISVENIRARPGVGYALVHLNSVVPIKSIQARNLHFPSNITTSGTTIGVWAAQTVDKLLINGITSAVSPTGGAVIRCVNATANISELMMSDVAVSHGTNSAIVNIGGSGSTPTIGRIVQSNVLHSGNGANIAISANAILTAANLSNVQMSGATSTNFIIRNQSASTPTVAISNIVVAQNSRMINLEGTGGAVLTGSGFQNLGSTVQLGRTAAQVLRCRVADFPVDVSLLGKSSGDSATNTNAALGCGVGTVISDGSQWKNLYTGAATS